MKQQTGGFAKYGKTTHRPPFLAGGSTSPPRRSLWSNHTSMPRDWRAEQMRRAASESSEA
jgi:hypothetical protein